MANFSAPFLPQLVILTKDSEFVSAKNYCHTVDPTR
jgi:hypothetical protein